MITKLPSKIASSSEYKVSSICIASSRVRIAVGYWITTIPKWLPKGNLSRFPKSLSSVTGHGLPFLRRCVNACIASKLSRAIEQGSTASELTISFACAFDGRPGLPTRWRLSTITEGGMS